jgi:flavin-dependent dehydrogenase
VWDAIVAGAGPAGAVAACVLAREGRRVLLIDTVDSAMPKIGEALPGAAARLMCALELPAPKRGGPHAAIGGNLSSGGSDELIAREFILEPDGPGWRLDRARFDADLRAGAVGAGAQYHSARVASVERRDEDWLVRFNTASSEAARWIIDATGRRASIARRVGAT